MKNSKSGASDSIAQNSKLAEELIEKRNSAIEEIENSEISEDQKKEKKEKIVLLTPTQIRLKEIERERKELIEISKKEKDESKAQAEKEKKERDELKLKEKEEKEKEEKAEREEKEKKINDLQIQFDALKFQIEEIEISYLPLKSKFDEILKELNSLKKIKSARPASSGKRDSSKPGVIASIISLIEDAGSTGISKDDILDSLSILFPEKDPATMKSTISAQVPYRINKERFEIAKTSDGKFFKV